MPTPATSSSRRRRGDWLILSLLIFVPRLLNPAVFLTADEPLFLEHARQFAAAFQSGNLAETAGIGYPGVTVAAWAALPVSLAHTELGAYAAGRLATALLNGLLLLALFGLSQRLLGRWPALIGVGLLALDPFTLGYTRLLHIAGPLALLMTLAGVSLALWLREHFFENTPRSAPAKQTLWQEHRWLLLVGLFSGLALLTKSTALLLGPMLAAAALGWGLSTGHWREGRWWMRLFFGGAAAALVAALTFVALWPAMWVDPAGTLALTFGKLFTDQEAGAGNLGMFWLGHFVQDPGPAFYPVAFLLKSTPWLLIGLLCNLIWMCFTFVKGRGMLGGATPPAPRPAAHPFLFLISNVSLWLFALTYLLIMTIASKKSIRYMLPAFPTLYLLAGAGLNDLRFWISDLRLFSRITNYNSPFTIHHSPFTIGLLAIALLIATILPYHPYYLTYYNPAVLGWRWAPSTLLVGWGEGLDGAANYLNQTAPQAVTAAWYEWLFPLLYGGQVEPVVPQENLLTAERTVLYINQVQRDIPGPNIIDYFRHRRQPEQTIRLNGIDYAWVYPGPVAGPTPAGQPATPVTAQYASELQLLGYTFDTSDSPNAAIVTLNWRVLTPPAAERFVFVRLLDAAGRVWAFADSPPVMGLWPVERWQPGMFIEDAQLLPIPAGTPPGPYRLEVGLYDPADGQPLPAAGLPVGPGGGLLLGEVTLPWTPVAQFDAPWPVPRSAPLSPNAALVGHTPLPAAATTGDLLSLEMGWQNTESRLRWGDIWENNVMFEWRSPGGERLAEQLDPLPLPIEQWGRGAVLRSRHEVIVPPTLNSGPTELWAMLHTGSDPAGEAFRLADLTVTAPPHNFDLPAAAQSPTGLAQLSEAASGATVTLAGYTVTPQADAQSVQLLWQTDAPLKASYRVFAQLLAPDGTLAAQSDALPAAGQRPTTGWLPGEIITDPHTLTLPPNAPPGQYRLIAGLYQPATGQRLPLTQDGGDAITVTEINKSAHSE